MSRCALLWLPVTVLALLALLLAMEACGNSPSIPVRATPSYAVTAAALNPPSIIVGNTSTSAITITPANGYTGTIHLSCSVNTAVNAVATCSFTTNPITITDTAPSFTTLTISTSTNTPAGSYAITVTATDGKNLGPSNGPQTPNLTISPPPSYTLGAAVLSPNPTSAGSTSNSAITITPANGYSGTVSLSCSIASGNAAPTCSFSTNPVIVTGTAPTTSTLTISTSANTPGGSYVITLAANDAKNLAPSNGTQTLNLMTAAVIQHVVIIFQENRTPDNLFHDTVLMQRGADIASSGVNSHGQTIPLSAESLGVAYSPNHSHRAFVLMYDNGKMDGADLIPVGCAKGAANCPPPNPQFWYVNPSEVQPYFQLAEQYTFGDRMFQTNQGPSFPAHQFIISGTSAPTATSNQFVAENAQGVPTSESQTGCLAPPAEFVYLINPDGKETTTTYPCLDHPTLTDELNNNGISWRYYTPSAGFLWTGPNAIQHMCGPDVPPPNATACVGSDWINNVVIPEKQVLTDISSGKLAQVSWVIPTGNNSDHASYPNATGGPSWVASIVNAIGNSAYWSDTAIIITWDDWGGWYDHVPPKIVNDGTSWGSGYAYGFRVPLIVVSPYARAGYISHVPHDFGSILNLVEKTFNLPSLGYADAYADDLSDCFDFTQSPITFQKIAAPLDAAHFINDKSTPTDPDDD